MKDFDHVGLRTEMDLGSCSVIDCNNECGSGITESVNSVDIVENFDV